MPMRPMPSIPLGVTTGTAIFLRRLCHHRIGRENQTCDRGCILQRVTGDLRGINNAHLDEVAILSGGSVVADGAVAFETEVHHP